MKRWLSGVWQGLRARRATRLCLQCRKAFARAERRGPFCSDACRNEWDIDLQEMPAP
jgi:endogenous inhibitor of DNA gyrase (YacG/DUF329 family)